MVCGGASPDVAFAHPLDGGRAAALSGTVDDTATRLGADGAAYPRAHGPFGRSRVRADRRHAFADQRAEIAARARPVRNGRDAFRGQARARRFATDEAQALLGGVAAHSMLSLDAPATAGYGLFLALLGHHVGWPVIEGGSQRMADALVAILRQHGGDVVADTRVASLSELPPAARGPLRSDSPPSAANCGRRAPDPLYERARAVPLRRRCVQDRLGARGTGPLDCE